MKFLRRVVLPLNTIALIFAFIWAINSGAVPYLSSTTPAPQVSTSGDGGFYALTGEPLGAAKGNGPGLGQRAPEFALLTPEGEIVRLSDFRGKVVLINFWATWCVPCRREFPELVRAYAEGASDVVVIGVDLQENGKAVREFADEFGAEFPIVIDTKGEVADAYRVLGLPSSFFIDRDGVLRAQFFGTLTEEIIADRLADARQPPLPSVE